MGDLVWRKVHYRQTSKGESTYKGTYAVQEVLGELQYFLSGKSNHTPKVSVNDIKEFKIPITDHWKENKVFLQSCLKDMKLPKHFKPILQLHRIEEVLSRLNGRRPPQNFLVVVPEWTCCLSY